MNAISKINSFVKTAAVVAGAVDSALDGNGTDQTEESEQEEQN